MSFSTSSGNSGGSGSDGRPSRTTLSEINVTPLVDVMLVLLIIFMVTAPMMQQGIEVKLPETNNAGMALKEDPFVIVIKPSSTSMSGHIFLDKMELPLPNLKAKLSAIFATRRSKEVYLQADRTVAYGFVAEVMAEIKGAGISGIGLVTMPKSQ